MAAKNTETAKKFGNADENIPSFLIAALFAFFAVK